MRKLNYELTLPFLIAVAGCSSDPVDIGDDKTGENLADYAGALGWIRRGVRVRIRVRAESASRWTRRERERSNSVMRRELPPPD